MPGTLSIAARAAGFGAGEEGISAFLKAMENGLIRSKDFLPKFADELNKTLADIDPTETMGYKLTQLSNSWERFKLSFFSGGFDTAMKDLTEMLTMFLDSSKGAASALGSLFKGFVTYSTTFLKIIGITVDELSALFGISHEGTDQMKADWWAVAGAIGAAVLQFMLFSKAFKALKGLFGKGKGVATAAGSAAASAGTTAAKNAPKAASKSTGLLSTLGGGAKSGGMLSKMLKVGRFGIPGLVSMLGVDMVTRQESDLSKMLVGDTYKALGNSPFSSSMYGGARRSEPVKLEINLTTDGSKLSEIIKADIKADSEAVIQSLLNNSTL